MDLGILVLTGIATILVAFGVNKATKTEERLKEEKSKRRKAEDRIADLEHLKSQEEHKNNALEVKIEKLEMLKLDIENIINGKRTSEEKETIIKKLVHDYQSIN